MSTDNSLKLTLDASRLWSHNHTWYTGDSFAASPRWAGTTVVGETSLWVCTEVMCVELFCCFKDIDYKMLQFAYTVDAD